MFKSGVRLAALAMAAAVAASALSAGRLIAVDSSRALYEINMATGAKTQIGTVSSNASTTAGLAYDRANNVVYVTSTGNDSLFTLDLLTGNATLVGAYGDSAIVMHGLEFDGSTGTLYGASGGSTAATNTFYRINTATGFATLIGQIGLTSFNNLGYNSATNVMYMTNSGSDSFYSMNRATGIPTLIGALGAGSTNPNGLAYNSDNGLMYMIDNNVDNLYTINMTTGAATLVGSTGSGNLLGLVYVNAVPEPASLAVLGLGAAALLRRCRR